MLRLPTAKNGLHRRFLLFNQLSRPFTAGPDNIPFSKDLYRILGVDSKADKTKIKSAYAALVKKHHPDVNKGKSSGELFKDINLAYSVLSNDTKKREYDQYLEQKSRMSQFNSSGFTGAGAGQYTSSGRSGPVNLHLL